MPTTILATRDGRLDAEDRRKLAELAARVTTDKTNVLLHLHGGLVNESAGRGVAERLAGAAPQGFGFAANWEQIYVVWRTGPLETLATNWTDLFDNDRIYQILLRRIVEFASRRLGVADATGRSAFSALNLSAAEIERRLQRGAEAGVPFQDVDRAMGPDRAGGRGPTIASITDGALEAELTQQLETDDALIRASTDVAKALSAGGTTGRGPGLAGSALPGAEMLLRLDPDIRAELRAAAPGAQGGRLVISGMAVLTFLVKHGVAIGMRTIRRFRQRRDHGFYATIIEELVRELYGDLVGATIWGMMKRDAADHFSAAGIGRELMNVLASAEGRIVVTAHSAGAIWATEMLKFLAKQSGPKNLDLVLLAPAVRVDLFAEMLAAAGTRIERFRIFTMSDTLERQDPVLGAGKQLIYPSSLLYLVSGIFEEDQSRPFVDAPILGMQRFLIGDPSWLSDPSQVKAVTEAVAFIAGHTVGIVYSGVDGATGLTSHARSHGDFDNEVTTLASVAAFAMPLRP